MRPIRSTRALRSRQVFSLSTERSASEVYALQKAPHPRHVVSCRSPQKELWKRCNPLTWTLCSRHLLSSSFLSTKELWMRHILFAGATLKTCLIPSRSLQIELRLRHASFFKSYAKHMSHVLSLSGERTADATYSLCKNSSTHVPCSLALYR